MITNSKYTDVYVLKNIASVGVLMTLLGNEFHSEIVRNRRRSLCEKKVGGTHYNQFYYVEVQEWEGGR